MEATPQRQGVEDFQSKARTAVVKYFNTNSVHGSDPRIFFEDVYVVWFCKVLGNWKALLSTDRPDDHYYEVTYDGKNSCMYLDCYVKAENIRIED